MCDLTAIINDNRWDDTSFADIAHTVLLYADPDLLTLGATGLARAMRFGSVKSLQNFLTRARERGHLAGEVGALQTPCPWLQRLVQPSSEPTPTASDDSYQRGYDAGYMAGLRARKRGEAETTTEPQINHNPHHMRTTRLTRAGASSGTGFGSGLERENLKTESGTETEEGGAGETAVAALVKIGMEETPARERVREFGAERVREAIDTLRWKQSQEKVESPAGYVVDFLVEHRPVPSGVYQMREKEAKIRAKLQDLERQEQEKQRAIAEADAVVARARAIQAQRAQEGGSSGQVERVAAGAG